MTDPITHVADEHPHPTSNDPTQSSDHGPAEGGSRRLPAWLTETPYWAISAVVHLVLLLVIGSVVLLQHEEEKSEELTQMRFERSPDPFDPRKETDVFEKPDVQIPEIDKVVITEMVEPTVEPPAGDPAEMADVDLDHDQVLAHAIAGGGPAGQHGLRGRSERRQASGAKGTESAVRAALEWLRRHQHPDGHWSSDEYFRANTDAPYKLIQYEGYSDGTGMKGFDVGVTALAMLAFLGFGETHQHCEYPEYRPVMQKALKWLLKQQVVRGPPEVQGRFGKAEPEEWIYNHALATMAVAESLVMTGDQLRLRNSVEKATRFCLRAQNEGYGWRYGYKPGRNDTSVTGWMVLALKTARQCARRNLIRIEVSEFKPAFEGALEWFRTSTASSGRAGYISLGDPGSSLTSAYEEPYPFSKDLSCMTAVSVLCRIFAGESRRSSDIRKGIALLKEQPPEWRPARGRRKSKINMYYWYYATYAMFQHGESAWRDWEGPMKEALIPTQIHGGTHDEHGSWDPVGEWGIAGGRVYATAINAMTLEVYYRFERATAGSAP